MTIELRASQNVDIVASGDWSSRPTHVVLRIGAHILQQGPLGTALTADVENGDRVRILDERAKVSLNVVDVGEAALNAILSAGVDEVACTASLHDGSPGAQGTANELAAGTHPGYVRARIPLESVVV